MNILIYIPDLSQEWGGIRQYTVGLLELLANDSLNNYIIYHNADDVEIMRVISNTPHYTIIKDTDVKIKEFSKTELLFIKIYNKFAKKLKLKLIEKPIIINLLCEKSNIHTIHCPYQYIPFASNVKLITTLHDVQEIHYPENFTAEERAWRANNYLDFLRRSDKIIVSFNHIKSDLIKYFDVKPEKIEIVLLSMQKLWFNKFSIDNIISIDRLNLPERFLLYPANTWSHKNHLRLIEAVANIRDEHKIIINVVCTGHKTDNLNNINELIQRLDMSNQICFTGVVNENELYTLYKKCEGVIIPTIYEAGSFPLYESILMGVPVICSNVTSLPETIGNDEFTFDPLDTKDIQKKMMYLWCDTVYRNKNMEHIQIRANEIIQNNPLPKILRIYENLN